MGRRPNELQSVAIAVPGRSPTLENTPLDRPECVRYCYSLYQIVWYQFIVNRWKHLRNTGTLHQCRGSWIASCYDSWVLRAQQRCVNDSWIADKIRESLLTLFNVFDNYITRQWFVFPDWRTSRHRRGRSCSAFKPLALRPPAHPSHRE